MHSMIDIYLLICLFLTRSTLITKLGISRNSTIHFYIISVATVYVTNEREVESLLYSCILMLGNGILSYKGNE